jgi:hypothetical protein
MNCWNGKYPLLRFYNLTVFNLFFNKRYKHHNVKITLLSLGVIHNCFLFSHLEVVDIGVLVGKGSCVRAVLIWVLKVFRFKWCFISTRDWWIWYVVVPKFSILSFNIAFFLLLILDILVFRLVDQTNMLWALMRLICMTAFTRSLFLGFRGPR